MRKALSALAMLAVFSTAPVAAQNANMSFFITSVGSGDGANLGGLAGADQHCQDLAAAAGQGNKVWRAYLSQVTLRGQLSVVTGIRSGGGAVNARDRIGEGPWYNYNGDLIARTVEELHSEAANLTKESILSEKGNVSNGRGDDPNMHDILTGSTMMGMVNEEEGHDACRNWTSNGEGAAAVGHHDRQGGGTNPTSWNFAHMSRGCSQTDLQGSGGNGFFYCFAVDANRPQEQPFLEW